jgi:hypothetical protein
MEPTTVDQTPASEPRPRPMRNTFKTPNAPADRHFKQMTVPGLAGTGPILPEWLRKPFRERFRRKDAPAAP